MNRHDDLPLFRWTPPKVEIIPFPTRNRIGHIRRTADRIHQSRTDREAEAYWRRALDGLSRQMEKAGVDQDRIEAELQAFQDCVQNHIARLARRPYRPSGEDIA